MLNFKFSALAALYAANVLDGGRTIDEVPAVIRPQVQTILDTAKKEDATPQA
ncbi:hypothetical protein I3F57_06235 [Lacticaseibacillus paracasei subsp. tolerans]|uniref:CD1375 family protein n=1 Tax=Lacticaseibacillus paracasei TaxID=1597 RepID=UPI0018AD3355|nr:CD1375 family protein [Lacticaseibacillus paracasei]QPI89340.1 hypothetical protein I3F57_06235 [Lacticaseibacillus paracasei subsp. tolerans]